MTTQLSEAELAELQALCAETGTDLRQLAAEARRWKAISGRLGLSLEMVLDALNGIPVSGSTTPNEIIDALRAKAG